MMNKYYPLVALHKELTKRRNMRPMDFFFFYSCLFLLVLCIESLKMYNLITPKKHTASWLVLKLSLQNCHIGLL